MDDKKRGAITTVRAACSAGTPDNAAISAIFAGSCKSEPLPVPSKNFVPAAMEKIGENQFRFYQ
jgi:hypothetical protein